MTEILKGKAFVDNKVAKLVERSDALKLHHVMPTLAVVRMGEKQSDLAYERGLKKRAVSAGVAVDVKVLDEDATQKELEDLISELNADEKVHGVLIFEPLPAQIDTEKAHKRLTPGKDVDGITAGSMATVYSGHGKGFAPCTAQGCIELLKYYGISLKGKNAVVLGRSTVIGKPAAMLLTAEDATVTICHSKTANMAEICRNADIIISCIGKAKFIDESYMKANQVIVDVGINFDEEGNMVGDVDFDAAMLSNVGAITPVPGGVGVVTTAVLMEHVIEAAERR